MKNLVFYVSALLLLGQSLSAQTPGIKNVEVSFVYAKQNGFASNQFAVWVEDAQGRYVKTLYATKFTATGGWKRRETSIPRWVKQSGLSQMNKPQVDALTGPTPKSGRLNYVWDGTNAAGLAVPAGEYRIFVEATLRNDNRVLYTAMVQLAPGGAPARITPQPEYFGTGAAERGMIGQVTVSY